MNYQFLIKISVVLAFCVIVLGAYTRLADAGLGCPDWPGCYGQLTVPETADEVENKAYLEARPLEPEKGWAEMVHRYFAGSLGLLILAIAIWSWKLRGRDWHQPVWLPTFLVAVVIFQAALGMWTVTLLLKPVVVMGHLLGGLATLGLLLLLLLRTSKENYVHLDQRMRGTAMLGLLVLIVQIALGGWTSTNYAALACTDFPTCHGEWFPEADFAEGFVLWRGLGVNYEFGVLENPARTAIHLTHRIGALVTFVYLGMLALVMLRRGGVLARAGLMMGLLLLIQVALGISNILLHLPLPVAVGHNGVAALLLLSVIYVNHLLWRRQH